MSDIENKQAETKILTLDLIFFEDKQISPNTFGSNSISYKMQYIYDRGIMNIWEIGAFGDSSLVKQLCNKNNKKITEKEMLENIEQISKMTYKEFKEKILKENKE